jgi:hypothetical protein
LTVSSLSRLVAPVRSTTCRAPTFNAVATASRTAAVARPSAAGAVTDTTSAGP